MYIHNWSGGKEGGTRAKWTVRKWLRFRMDQNLKAKPLADGNLPCHVDFSLRSDHLPFHPNPVHKLLAIASLRFTSPESCHRIQAHLLALPNRQTERNSIRAPSDRAKLS